MDRPCWGLHFDKQLNLSFNFGKPSLRVREPLKTRSKSPRVQLLASTRNVTVKGKWWLWLYCCRWRLSRHGELLATDSSSSGRIDSALRILGGQKLSGVKVKHESGATHFAFDLGCELDCRRYATTPHAELWCLHFPTGKVLAVHGDGSYSYESGSSKFPVRQRIPE
jgi:hypothetical protein